MYHRIIRKENAVAIWATGLLAVCVLLVATGCCPPSEGVGDNRISEYSIGGSYGVIDDEMNSIIIEVPEEADLASLVAEFTVQDGATVSVGGVVQVSGVTANDFRFPVVYTVSSTSGPVETYVVNVTGDSVSTYVGSQDPGLVPWVGVAVVLLLVVAGATIYVRRTEISDKN